ncbi:right-handed parallel beta-helix repeat-containing protein [Candidatus Thiodiazotropha sp. CDECU1]|uniref:right-handed parallel beta-helix repeat-containing protein n=1 Tax=Candidatus Thiodiazotropha sp. CDECU1 TaxID=3065865 RepID=UPI00292FE17B|nr:right-handed parallel beta-helix repeat-containing protein [Candidatus Thiodiazotropha sp. CDECU1]
MKKLILFATLLLAFSLVQAKTLYVDASTGSDSTTYDANSSSQPWASLGRAVWGSTSRTSPNSQQAARAADVVIVRAGTYTTNQGIGSRYIPIYNPVNSGSAGSPITFRAEGNVILASPTSSAGEPIVGAYDNSHIVWDGFILDERNINTTPDTGPVVIWTSDNITIQNFTIRSVTAGWHDNHNAIRVESSRDSLVRNNTIYGNRNADGNTNGSAIMTYTSSNITFEYNDISESNGGIFIKGHNIGPFTIRNNYIHDIDVAAVTFGTVGSAGVLAYQNIIRDSFIGYQFVGYDSSNPANIDVVNNTIYNCVSGFALMPGTSGYRDIVIANNLVVGGTRAIQAEDISNIPGTTFRYNMYYNNGSQARVYYQNYSSSGWQSSFNQDVTGSQFTNPQLSDVSANNLTLSSNSPALNAGVDMLNLLSSGTNASINIGARVSSNDVIGASGAAPDTQPTVANSPPSSPFLY